MTNVWMDIKNADVITIMGGNAAEAHPCGFKWVTEAKAHNKAKLLVVDPRFTRSAAVADLYVPIRQGADIAWLNGLINYLLSSDKIQKEYVKSYTNAAFIVKEGFDFADGLFSGYNAERRDYERSSWEYEMDEQGMAKVDATLEHPRSVYQIMKKFFARYTPDMVSRITGSPKDKMLKAWELMATTHTPDRGDDVDVCTRLDTTFQGLAEHPRHGDGAIASRQYRHCRRWHERIARTLEHPGPDGFWV